VTSGGPIADMVRLKFGWRTMLSRIVLLFPIILQSKSKYP
jgi:hypothetical protein